jgi:hypothetical protein
MVVALLALFVALGGSAYAVSQINGKQIKNRTIAAKKIVKNTLTGTEINESKLGQVPNAQHANVATGAITLQGLPASAFSQVHSFSNELDLPNNDFQQTVLDIPGVGTIEGSCDLGGEGTMSILNATGQTVATTVVTVIAPGNASPDGKSVANGGVMLSYVNQATANLHAVLAWEDGVTKHFADITVGNFKDGGVCHFVAKAEVG